MKFLPRLPGLISIKEVEDIYIAISGGPDSVALAFATVDYLSSPEVKNSGSTYNVHLVSVLTNDSFDLQSKDCINRVFRRLVDLAPSYVKFYLHIEEPPAKEPLGKADWRDAINLTIKRLAGTSEPQNFIVLKGHHLDDHIETYVLWSLWGGPKTMNVFTPTSFQLRPLSFTRKSTVYDYLERRGLSGFYLEDPQNHDGSNARSYYRINMSKHVESVAPQLPRVVEKILRSKLPQFKTLEL